MRCESRYVIKMFLCIWSLSCTLHIKMFLAHPSRLPANIVIWVVLMFLIFEQLCKHKSHVFRQSVRWPLVTTNQLSALRFDNNAHGDKKLTTRRDELEFIPAEFFCAPNWLLFYYARLRSSLEKMYWVFDTSCDIPRGFVLKTLF